MSKRKYNLHKSNGSHKFYSNKNGCHIWHESNNERNRLLMLEFDENVISYSTQTETFDYMGIKYTPDILVHTKRSGDYYEEPKGEYFLKQEGFYDRFELNKKCVKSLSGLELHLIKESVINKAPLLTLNKLNKYKKQEVNDCIDLEALPTSPLLFSQLQALICTNFDANIGDVLSLFSHFVYKFDLKTELTPDSLVWKS